MVVKQRKNTYNEGRQKKKVRTCSVPSDFLPILCISCLVSASRTTSTHTDP